MHILSHMRHPTQLHSGGTDWPKIRILVFSLDDAFRFLSRQTFRKLNVREVLSTSVPADATPMLGQAPDIALIDTDGDLKSAQAFLQRVRGIDADMPVLLVAKAEDRARLGGVLALGVEGVVPKPVSGHELVHRVGAALKAPRRMPLPAAKETPKPRVASVGGGGGPGFAGRGRIGGGSYGDAAPSLERLSSDGGVAWLGDDGPVATKPGAGTYGGEFSLDAGVSTDGGIAWLGDDDLVAGGKVVSGGSYGSDAAPAVANVVKSAIEVLGDALPEALKPKRRRKHEEERAKAERAEWQAELAEAGHKSRSGKDVAGLDVDAIVAAHLQWLTSQGGEGKRADFKKMDMAGGALAGTVLANADFRQADLSDSQLTDARLDGADFRHASLSAADLSGANLGVAQLRHCDLRLANLQGASLRGADLSGARLRGAKLAGADFKGAILVGSDLAEADLSKVENLTQAQMDKALCDMKTKLPPGVSRPRKEEAAPPS